MNSQVKTIIFWVVVVCMAVLLWAVVNHGHGKPNHALNFTEFLNDVDAGNIKNATIDGTTVKGDYVNGQNTYTTTIVANYPELYTKLKDHGVTMIINDSSASGWLSMLVNFSPIILVVGFWIFMMRQMQSGGNKAMSFGKSRARLHSTQQRKVTFKDVAGVEEAKEDLVGKVDQKTNELIVGFCW